MNISEWQGVVSLFDSVTSKKAKELPIPWHGLVEMLEAPKTLPDKAKAGLFTGAVFTERQRRKDKAKTACLLMLDYDHAPAMRVALPSWRDWSYLAYTTWSHGTDEKGNAYRVIIPLAEPIPAADYPALWQWAFEQSGGKIDQACKDVSRIMYLPACPSERRGLFQFVKNEGAALDWRALSLPAMSPKKPSMASVAPSTSSGSGLNHPDKYTRKALESAAAKIAGADVGTRNPTLNNEAFTLGGLVAATWCELTRQQAVDCLLAAALASGLSETEAHATIKSGLDAGEKKPRQKPDAKQQAPINRGKNGTAAVSEGVQGDKSDAADNAKAETKIPAKFALKDGALLYGEPDEHTGEIEHKFKVCGHLEVAAVTVDGRGGNEGRLLKFKTRRGQWREFVIPMGMLFKDLGELTAMLAGMGLRIENHKATKGRIAEYINDCEPADVFTTTDATGWHGKVFVLTGGEIIGKGEKVIFAGADTDIYTARGNLQQWRDKLAALAVGNSRLEFSLSLAFAGVLMHLTGDDGAGVNMYGLSSTGKTTTQVLAASVWGSPEPGGFISKWNATATGLEIQAVMRNHTLFCIDELGEVDPKIAGRLIYQLASGVQKGRGRASDSGIGLANLKTWKMPFISSAEKTLSQHIEEAGARLYGGQAVRCVDIPADAGAGFGAFEALHGLYEQHRGNADAAGAAFSDLIKERAKRQHGTAGRAFVAELLKMGGKNALAFIAEQRREFAANVPADASGLARRAAKLFSLAGAAGELATKLKILPWEPGAAMTAARRCFTDWLAENGAGNPEERQALSQVLYFIERGNFCTWNDLQPGRFDKVPQVAAYIGVIPVEHQSGTSVNGRPHLSKAGDGTIRAKLYMAAITAVRYNPDVKALYERLLAKGKSKMAALGAAMRKLVHICFGVLKTQTPYSPRAA